MAPQELASFGIDRELEYTGHITLATHLVPLPRRTFASSDETHIRIWGAAGDIVKTTFPSNRRSMVSAMTFCPTFNALLTTEVDMTMKAYFIYTLDLLDTFSLAQAHKKGEKGAANEKVSAMVYLPQHCWVLVGGENGCDLWQLSKTMRRRARGRVGRLEHHLQLDIVRRVTTGAVINIVADMGEKRIIMWGQKALSIFDTDLNLITNYRKPHTEPMRCACIQILSILDTALLTGGEDGNVNFWSIQGKTHEGGLDSLETSKSTDTASMRLEHSFRGHARAIEMVLFYDRKQAGQAQNLCVSYARDGKMKVWSLLQFSIVYTLDITFLDSKVFVFPLANHLFAVAAAAAGSSQIGGQQRTNVTLMRFTAHMACPFATTNQSAVVLINRPLPPTEFCRPVSSPLALSGAVALVSEDVAIRIIDAETKGLISCLPPPPNSKVQVLCVFIIPIWQILVLWMSSQEIAVFFVPTASSSKAQRKSQSKEDLTKSEADEKISKRAMKSTTPLLIRRFSILEIRAHSFDKDLPKESFRSVCLHHGKAPPCRDALTQSSFENGQPDTAENSGGEHDWFLMIGTHLGTVQAYRVREILAASPIWSRIAKHLPTGSWKSHRTFNASENLDAAQTAASDIEQARLDAFAEELEEAMESAKVAGQRPFPRDAPKLRFYGRWKCHDYFVEVTESVTNTILTLDMKRNLRLWNVATMQCIFQHQLDHFTCYAPYIQPIGLVPSGEGDMNKNTSAHTLAQEHEDEEEDSSEGFSGLDACPEDVLGFSGLALGGKSGSLHLVLLDGLNDGEPEIMRSAASHTKEIMQVDFIWPINVIVTIGCDDAMKIWSHGLVLLREIAFPQPLTSVSFRHRQDLDTSQGHGDILLGFSCHVESLSFDYWSHGAPVSLVGRNAIRGRAAQTRSLFYTDRGLAMLDASDDINEHSTWLQADDPMGAREYMLARKGVSLIGASHVLQFKDKMMEATRSPSHPKGEAIAHDKRLQQGEVTDFRGRALIEIGTLSGQSVDHAVLQLPNRPSKEPSVRHQRTNHPSCGDFEDYTHARSGYYDQYVLPNNIIDAPRIHAIRGGVDGNDAAIITSVGSKLPSRSDTSAPQLLATGNELEETTELFDSAVREESKHAPKGSEVLSQWKRKAIEKAKASAEAKVSSEQALHAPKELMDGPVSSDAAHLQHHGAHAPEASTHGPVSAFDALQQQSIPKLGDEPWRCKRIGRGVPKEDVNRPVRQDIANSDLDTARMLKDRGNIAEVPDLPEENQLKRLLAKKAEWLYSPKDSLVLRSKRHSIKQMGIEQTKTQTWTLAGRLVCDPGNRPPAAGAPFPILPPPHVLNQRAPCTRMEVTEQRIIQNATMPPAPPRQFTLEPRSHSARGPAGPHAERNSVSAEEKASGTKFTPRGGRYLMDSPRAPLTSR